MALEELLISFCKPGFPEMDKISFNIVRYLKFHKEPTEKILAYFEEIVPEYDKERVYVSDMKKIIQWYNLLTEKGMLDLDEEAKEEEKKEA